MDVKKIKYAIITSAYNEEKNIEKTINSVLSQTKIPDIWLIISDGSTDRTDEIVAGYLKKNKFISFFRISEEEKHGYSSKVHALNKGITKLKNKEYDYIGIIDADISFSSDYFEELLKRFAENPQLGIGGGIIYEIFNNKRIKQNISLNSVAGAVQFFRYQCLKDVGNFIPLKYGGEDAAAEITARMKSWEVETFPELGVDHYGYVGKQSGNLYRAKYRRGKCFFQLGYHPIFQILRCIHRLKDRPLIIGSMIELLSFFLSYVRRDKILLPGDTIKYLRQEQMQRLKYILRN